MIKEASKILKIKGANILVKIKGASKTLQIKGVRDAVRAEATGGPDDTITGLPIARDSAF